MSNNVSLIAFQASKLTTPISPTHPPFPPMLALINRETHTYIGVYSYLRQTIFRLTVLTLLDQDEREQRRYM